MAEIVMKKDDIDGSPADEEIAFSIGGKSFVIDLSTVNADTFREVMAPWIAAARPVASPNGHRKPRNKESRERSAAIRAWAHAMGMNVSDKGRIPNDVVKQFDNQM